MLNVGAAEALPCHKHDMADIPFRLLLDIACGSLGHLLEQACCLQGQACMALRWALFAEKYSLPQLAATCERFIMLHFNDVAPSPEIAQVLTLSNSKQIRGYVLGSLI